jgi:hypothetical protein
VTAEPIPWRPGILLLAAAGAMAGYAVWSRPYVPLIDWPNHMARHHLEAARLTGELPPFYAVEYRLIPNLGGDLVLPVLIRHLGPWAAGNLFLTLALVLYWLGPALFLAECGAGRARAFTAALLLLPWALCNPFFWGFLNYYSGVGVAFLALAHYLNLSRRPRLPLLGLLVHAALVALLFLWHLAAWGIYGVLFGCHLLADTLARRSKERRLGPALARASAWVLAVTPSLVLLVVSWRTQNGLDFAAAVEWGGWARKARILLTPFRGYDWVVDAAAGLLWVAAAAACFGPAAKCERLPRWLLLGAAVLAALYLALPYQVGATSDADSRALPPLLICGVALLAFLPLRRPRLGLALLAACLLLRYGSVLVAWHQLDARLAPQARAFAQLPPHSRVLPVLLTPEGRKEDADRHFLAWAVVERDVYLPTLFAHRGQQPLTLRGPPPLTPREREGVLEFDEDALRGRYDYVWLLNPEDREVRLPASAVRIVQDGPLSVWRVR